MNQETKIAIPDKLRPYIKQVWYIDGSTENAFPFFADGCPGMVFQQSDTGMFACDHPRKIPSSYVFGQTVRPITLHAPKNCTIIGVIFHPFVLQPLFRFSAHEITDDFLDLDLLPDLPQFSLKEQLWNSNTPEKQLSLIFHYLGSLIDKNRSAPDDGLAHAASQIIRLNGNVSMQLLQRELNVSERTFERRFEEHVGLSPRLLCRIAQFQAALKQLRSDAFFKLSDIAYENNYADQSHFIRQFKKFTGVSPLQYYKVFRADPSLIS